MSAASRTVYGFTMHGRGEEGVVDYPQFLQFLAEQPLTSLQTSVGDEMVAITSISLNANIWRLRFVRGQEGIPPITYDPVTGEESYDDIGRRLLVNYATAYMQPDTRFAAIERRRPGVGATQMSLTLSHLGRELGFDNRLTFSFNPVTDRAFLSELRTFERIREAEVELARPNYDWSDNAAALSELAGESNAGQVAVRVTAARGDELSTDSGIVADVENLVERKFSPLRNVKISGRRSGEGRETTISLRNFQTKRYATIPDGTSVSTESDLVREAAADLLQDLAEDSHDESQE